MIEEGTITARPFLKWVGGKNRLLPQLLPLIPEKYNDYYEPFLGGGAFYFGLPNVGRAYLNDINQHLVAAYQHIRDDLDAVIKVLKRLEDEYHLFETEDLKKLYYLERRAEFNRLKDSNFRKTALLIFLNKTCFNGMYRENSAGDFNVPFNKSRNPTICDEKNLKAVSQKLQDTTMSSGNYEEVVNNAKKDDFIYFDPPYFPLSSTSSFTNYHASGFQKTDQEKLRGIFTSLKKRGCYVMLSNSAAKEIREFYKDFRQVEVMAARSINSVGTGRGKIAELVILSY